MQKLLLTALLVLLWLPLFATGVECTWNANTETDLAGYKVQYGTATGVYTQTIDVGKVLIYNTGALTEGKTYYFVVLAYDTSGNVSGPSTEASIYLPIPDVTPPPIPTGLVSTVSGSIVAIKWNAVVATDLAGYGVYDNGILIGNVTSASFVTGSLPQGKHTFTVDSVDKTVPPNRSAQSVASVVTIDVTPPVPPTGLKLKILQLLAWLKLIGGKG